MGMNLIFRLEPPVHPGREGRVAELRAGFKDCELRARPGCLGGLFSGSRQAAARTEAVALAAEWRTLFVDPIEVLLDLVIGERPFANELLFRGYLPLLQLLEQPSPIPPSERPGRRPGEYSAAELGVLRGTRLGDLPDPSGDWPRVLAAACEQDASCVVYEPEDGLFELDDVLSTETGAGPDTLEYAEHLERMSVQKLRSLPDLAGCSDAEIENAIWTQGELEEGTESSIDLARNLLELAFWIRTWVGLGFRMHQTSDDSDHDPLELAVSGSPLVPRDSRPTGRWPAPLSHVPYEPLGPIAD